jgi:hypothetical protein
MSDSVRKLRWKRRILFTWPVLVPFALAVYLYFAVFHTTLCWLTQNKVPITDWEGHFELDTQIFPLFVFVGITILILFQRMIGAISLLFGTIVSTIGCGTILVRYYFFNSSYHFYFDSPPLLFYWIYFVFGILLSIGVFVSLCMVNLIDDELKSLKKNLPETPNSEN